jgi:putative peptide zinc metalloprotease protein
MNSNAETLELPALREDLRLLDGPAGRDGAPTWTLYDPPRGRYFRIGWPAFRMLSCWSAGTVGALVEKVGQDSTCRVSMADALAFLRFLYANSLSLEPAGRAMASAATEAAGRAMASAAIEAAGRAMASAAIEAAGRAMASAAIEAAGGKVEAYLAQYRASRSVWWVWLLHHYLFFRVPLVRPERFLRATLPYLRGLFDVRVAYALAAWGVLALYLVSRQWETFLATFPHFFNWQGLLLYAAALALAKVLHELGHAYAAVRYGCHVPTMGVAFLVLFPVLYTDVTDAWRLTSRSQRLVIGAAGMLTELALAVLATLAWSFLPDGPWRSAAFILASVTWVMTLAINLSPFMRFDGYYLLADWWGVDNLQARAFALARWRLRRLLFATPEAKPETLPAGLERRLMVYAYATWLYRLTVFTGIALMVYHLFFKLLGLVLFAVEIGWFIVLPVAKELRAWWDLRATLPGGWRRWAWPALMLVGLILLFVPWQARVRVPAVLEAGRHTVLFAPEPGRIEAVPVHAGQAVSEGQEVLRLSSPQLDVDLRRSERRLEFYRLRLARSTTTREESADLHVAMQQLAAEASRHDGLRARRERLVVRAPFAGTLADMTESLHTGRWVDRSLPLAVLVQPGAAQLQGLVPESGVGALAAGQAAEFIPESPLGRTLKARVAAVEAANVRVLDMPYAYLASLHGGDIAVREGVGGSLEPVASVFAIRFEVEEAHTSNHVVRGTVQVDVAPRSLAKRLYETVLAVLIRESGF